MKNIPVKLISVHTGKFLYNVAEKNARWFCEAERLLKLIWTHKENSFWQAQYTAQWILGGNKSYLIQIVTSNI